MLYEILQCYILLKRGVVLRKDIISLVKFESARYSSMEGGWGRVARVVLRAGHEMRMWLTVKVVEEQSGQMGGGALSKRWLWVRRVCPRRMRARTISSRRSDL